MANISLNMEPVKLSPGVDYIVIDPLYVSDFKVQTTRLKAETWDEFRIAAFPYADNPFAQYKPQREEFTLNQIRKTQSALIKKDDKTALCNDSGILLFVNDLKFLDVVDKLDYGKLVDSQIGIINVDYWCVVIRGLEFNDAALVVSPGLNKGVDFVGSGLYEIAN